MLEKGIQTAGSFIRNMSETVQGWLPETIEETVVAYDERQEKKAQKDGEWGVQRQVIRYNGKPVIRINGPRFGKVVAGDELLLKYDAGSLINGSWETAFSLGQKQGLERDPSYGGPYHSLPIRTKDHRRIVKFIEVAVGIVPQSPQAR